MRWLAGLLLGVFSIPLAAQEPPDIVARMTMLRPTVGIGLELAQGYREHLKWHAQVKDPWTWLGWQIVTGERAGWVLDGSFGLSWADLDAPVDPAGDIADFLRTVAPTGEAAFVGVWRERVDLGGRFAREQAPYLVMTTVALRTGEHAAVWTAFRAVATGGGTWFQVAASGEAPVFVLMQQCRNWPEIGAAQRRVEPITRLPQVSLLRTEVLRYRPDLFYAPAKND